jgi:phenylacetate-coenzyme A ligase PaaK-like adenylate-forming protein
MSTMTHLALCAADLVQQAALRNPTLFRLASTTAPAGVDQLSAYAAVRTAARAFKRVPAYRQFLTRAGFRDDPRLPAAERMRRLPETDKDRYIRAFSTEERCVDGAIPMAGTQIDESSGTPYNWVRGVAELTDKHREMSQFICYCCGSPSPSTA